MLTQEQLDFFHTTGYLIMRGLIGGRELAVLQEQADQVIAQGLARQGEYHLYRNSADGRKTYWRSEEMWQRDPIFLAVTVHPDLLENIGQCLGQAFYPWNDSLVVKVAQALHHRYLPGSLRSRERVCLGASWLSSRWSCGSGSKND